MGDVLYEFWHNVDWEPKTAKDRPAHCDKLGDPHGDLFAFGKEGDGKPQRSRNKGQGNGQCNHGKDVSEVKIVHHMTKSEENRNLDEHQKDGREPHPHRVMKPVHPCGVKPREHAGIPIGDEVPRHRDDDEEGEHHGVTGYDLGDGVDRLCADPLLQDVDGRGHDIVRFRFRGCICLDEGADFLLRAFIHDVFKQGLHRTRFLR